MATSFYTLNYTFHKPPFVNAHNTFYKTWWNGRFPKYKTNRGLISSCCNSYLGVQNTIGIIGGVSVDSTVYFLKRLVHWSEKGENCPPFLLCCDPVLNKELSLIRRNLAHLYTNKNEESTLDATSFIENTRDKMIYLERCGVCCIVMPCHISHSWHNEISEGCSVPFLHMGECVAKELKEAKLKPLEAGSPLRIGLLATSESSAGVYQEKLESEDNGRKFEIPIQQR